MNPITLIGLSLATLAAISIACGIISLLEEFGVIGDDDEPDKYHYTDYRRDEPEKESK